MEEDGMLVGHLVDEKEEILYNALVKEGVIEVV